MRGYSLVAHDRRTLPVPIQTWDGNDMELAPTISRAAINVLNADLVAFIKR